MERPVGLEPTSVAWKATAQPLYQGRLLYLVVMFKSEKLRFCMGPRDFSRALSAFFFVELST